MRKSEFLKRKPGSTRATLLFAGFLILFMAQGTALAQDASRGNVNVLLGQRNMNSDWDPVDEQALFAVEVDYARESWPVNILFGIAGSAGDGSMVVTDGWSVASVDITGTTSELYGGVRKYFDAGPSFSPYMGGGLSMIRAEASASSGGFKISGDDTTMGFFLDCGAVYRAGSFNIGLDLRLLTGASMEIAGYSIDANYVQAALVIGYGW